MKTTKRTVGYSRHKAILTFTVINLNFNRVLLIFLLASAQAVGHRVYHEKSVSLSMKDTDSAKTRQLFVRIRCRLLPLHTAQYNPLWWFLNAVKLYWYSHSFEITSPFAILGENVRVHGFHRLPCCQRDILICYLLHMWYNNFNSCCTECILHTNILGWGGGGAICKNRLIAQTLVRTCTVMNENTCLIIFKVLTKMTPFSIPFGVKRPLNIPRIYSFGQKHTLEYTVLPKIF